MDMFDFLKNFSLDRIEFRNGEIDSKIISRLNFEKEVRSPAKEVDFLGRIRNVLLDYMMKSSVISILITLFVVLIIFTGPEVSLMYLTSVGMVYVFIFYYPQIKKEKGYGDLNQELPYALRHMGIELKSGKGLHDALTTIKNANYGSLSSEFTRVLEEIKFGKATEDSLLEMSKRVKSEGLSRAVQQIIGTLRVGGNLSNSLDIIAKDISFDMQIKLKEYSQKLNSMILIYTFLAILAPVITLIMLMAGSTVIGDVISSELLLVIYCLFFPSIVMFMGIFIKKLEPKI